MFVPFLRFLFTIEAGENIVQKRVAVYRKITFYIVAAIVVEHWNENIPAVI